ncbi:hypothetical protein AbraIFM66950_011640 [Aspergillus brasiliensis]|nr:hypothetical protein AbraIFM66950_011640 [Aspergillus brasiliensis]
MRLVSAISELWRAVDDAEYHLSRGIDSSQHHPRPIPRRERRQSRNRIHISMTWGSAVQNFTCCSWSTRTGTKPLPPKTVIVHTIIANLTTAVNSTSEENVLGTPIAANYFRVMAASNDFSFSTTTSSGTSSSIGAATSDVQWGGP